MKKYIYLILFLLLVGLVYFIFIYKGKSSQVSVENIVPQEEQVVTPVSQTEPVVSTEPQKYEDLKWETYINNDLGISFEYPKNLQSANPEASLSIDEKNKTVSITTETNYVFRITYSKNWTGTPEEWISSMNFVGGDQIKSEFNKKPAIFYKITDVMQVPSDIYVLKSNGNIYEIEYATLDYTKNTIYNPVVKRILNSLVIK